MGTTVASALAVIEVRATDAVSNRVAEEEMIPGQRRHGAIRFVGAEEHFVVVDVETGAVVARNNGIPDCTALTVLPHLIHITIVKP